MLRSNVHENEFDTRVRVELRTDSADLRDDILRHTQNTYPWLTWRLFLHGSRTDTSLYPAWSYHYLAVSNSFEDDGDAAHRFEQLWVWRITKEAQCVMISYYSVPDPIISRVFSPDDQSSAEKNADLAMHGALDEIDRINSTLQDACARMAELFSRCAETYVFDVKVNTTTPQSTLDHLYERRMYAQSMYDEMNSLHNWIMQTKDFRRQMEIDCRWMKVRVLKAFALEEHDANSEDHLTVEWRMKDRMRVAREQEDLIAHTPSQQH